MKDNIKEALVLRAEKYNDPVWFEEDPISFPRKFLKRGKRLEDIEIAAVFAAHFAWGRRSMIVRDCNRLFEHMDWSPYDYVMDGEYRCDDSSIHRTVKWSEVAGICSRLKQFYSSGGGSLETLDIDNIRTMIYGQKEDRRSACKKINMMRRWMVRDDGKVDLGLWRNTDKRSLLIPLDVHVYYEAVTLGLTSRRQKDRITASEITDAFREIWPQDPCKGDFALFGHGIDGKGDN